MDKIISRALTAVAVAGTAALMAAAPAVADGAPSDGVSLNTGKSPLRSLMAAKPVEMIKNAKVLDDSLKMR
ncbi:hypothetical protein [Streptomyces sp. NPDC046939]|uniref:hypothetical protein n=1 Tax=Streptomyces sp. NPDC046939 TaxID=3155376 RepID=UPI0033C87A6B